MKLQIQPGKSFLKFSDRTPMLENRKNKLRLDMNESLVGCSRRVRTALRQLDSRALSMYPEKQNAAVRIAPFFGARPDEIILTGGIDDALRLVSDVFLEPGSSVLLIEPTFPMYRFYAEQHGARIRVLRCDEHMQIPFREVLHSLRQSPSVFFLANPNNPTGTLLGKKTLAQMLDAALHTLVVLDEAYFEFSGVTVLPWIKRRRNLVVTRTLSKAAGLAGLRVGCLFAHRDTAGVLKRAQAPFPVGIAPLVAAEAALGDFRFSRRAVAEVLRGRKVLRAGLRSLGIRTFPSAANFVLADLGPHASNIIAELSNRSILIRDQSSSVGPGFARITAGPPSHMRRFLRELAEVLQNFHAV